MIITDKSIALGILYSAIIVLCVLLMFETITKFITWFIISYSWNGNRYSVLKYAEPRFILPGEAMYRHVVARDSDSKLINLEYSVQYDNDYNKNHPVNSVD
jgi:hypothetical protein